MSSTLCNLCQRFDIHSFSRDEWKQNLRGYPYRHVVSAATAGCSFCSLLVVSFGSLRGFDFDDLTKESGSIWFHFKLLLDGRNTHEDPNVPTTAEFGDDAIGLGAAELTVILAPLNYPRTWQPFAPRWLFAHDFQAGWRILRIPFNVAADLNSPAVTSGDIAGRYSGEDLVSQDRFHAIQSLLSECDKHDRCRQTWEGTELAPDVPLPTRCVEITDGKLYIRQTKGQRGRYIALSHRWHEGTTELSQTTTDNYQDRISGISLEGIPKTFLDAATVAKGLDISFVWIDSLCIIQKGDDYQDWRHEGRQMGTYYTYAHLTIFATAGHESTGLFPVQDRSAPKLAQLPYRDRHGIQRGYFYVFGSNKLQRTDYKYHVEDSDLRSRGWVLQEWILSRRVVYYTSGGMFFECRSHGPRSDRGERIPTDTRDTKRGLSLRESFEPSDNPFRYYMSVWYDLVEIFSTLKLSFPEKDRVMALSGIATLASSALRSQQIHGRQDYAAGLWLEDLPLGLLWQCEKSHGTPARIAGFPSWSWASILTPVIYSYCFRCQTPTDAITDMRYVLPGQPANQESENFEVDYAANSAQLYLKGRIQRVQVRELFSSKQDIRTASILSGYHGNRDKCNWRKISTLNAPTTVAGWASFEDPDFQSDGAFVETSPGIYALHVSTIKSRKTVYNPCEIPLLQQGFGLGFLNPFQNVFNVLFLISEGGQEYRRIGTGRLFGKDIQQSFGVASVEEICLI